MTNIISLNVAAADIQPDGKLQTVRCGNRQSRVAFSEQEIRNFVVVNVKCRLSLLRTLDTSACRARDGEGF